MVMSNWMWLPNWRYDSERKATLAEFVLPLSITEEELFKLDASTDVIRISADSRYKLYVGEKLVQYGPAKSNDQVWYYDEFSLVPYLNVGENLLRVEILYYHHPGKNENFGVFHSAVPGFYWDSEASEIPGIHGEWKGRIRDGFTIVSESAWFAPLQIMENRVPDPAAEWQTAEYYNTDVYGLEVAPGNLEKRPIPFMYLEEKRFTSFTAPVTVPAGTMQEITLNAGEEETGFFYLRMKQGKGSQVKITYSESYYLTDENGRPYKNVRDDSVNGHIEGFEDNLLLDGSDVLYSPFWFRTFRFVKLTLTAAEEDLILEDVFFEETGYPLEVKTTIETSDPEMNEVWDISLRTLKRCMQETYTDCPYYEQLQYAMDSRAQILFTYAVSGDDRLARECMRAFARSQRYDGLVNAAYPSTATNVIPGFTCYYLLMLYDHMMYFGDRAFLKEFVGTIEKALYFFESHRDATGMVGKIGGINRSWERFWSFIDWVKEWNETTGSPAAMKVGPITMESLLYVAALDASAAVMEFVGRESTAKEYRCQAEEVREAIRKNCTGRDGMIMDGPGVDTYSQHCQVWGVLTKTFTDPEIARKALAETTLHVQEYAQCSVAMSYYLFRALEEAGLYELTDAKWEMWRNMVRVHLTTCVEDGVRGRSDCHAWGALALYELPAVLLGARPTAPGYAEIDTRMRAGCLDWIKGDLWTPQGMIHREVRK